jgi:SulP family sulfate permease
LITASVVLFTLLFLAPIFSLMPMVTLAVVVIGVSVPMINPVEFNDILRIHKLEFCWALVAFGGVVLLGVFQGMFIAVVVSLATLIYQANHPPVYALGRKKGTDVYRSLEAYPTDETVPGLLIVRTEGRLTFASIPRTTDKFHALIDRYSPTVIVLDLSAVPDIEYTALMMLDEAEEKLRRRGITLWLAALTPSAFKTVERSPLGQRLGHERMFYTVEHAVEQYLDETRKRSLTS